MHADPNRDVQLLRLAHLHESARERGKFTRELSVQVLKMLVLINGGAIIAILTFVGNVDADYQQLASSLEVATNRFSLGLAMGLFAAIAAYVGSDFGTASFEALAAEQAVITQGVAAPPLLGRMRRIPLSVALVFMFAAWGLAIASASLFIAGADAAADGFIGREARPVSTSPAGAATHPALITSSTPAPCLA